MSSAERFEWQRPSRDRRRYPSSFQIRLIKHPDESDIRRLTSSFKDGSELGLHPIPQCSPLSKVVTCLPCSVLRSISCRAKSYPRSQAVDWTAPLNGRSFRCGLESFASVSYPHIETLSNLSFPVKQLSIVVAVSRHSSPQSEGTDTAFNGNLRSNWICRTPLQTRYPYGHREMSLREPVLCTACIGHTKK